MKTNGNDIIGKIYKDSRHLPSPVNKWISDLSSNSWQVILANSKNQINDIWETEIYSRYQRSIKNRYPIYKSSTQNTSLEDFSDFFGPDGHYTSFLKKNLFPFLDTRRSRWRVRSLENQKLAISQKTINELREGYKIKDAFFTRDDASIKVNFQLKPDKLDAKARRVTLQLDNEKLIYRHGPQRTTSLTWPFTDTPDSSKVSILFNTETSKTGVRKSGTWAFFRLLNEANIHAAGAADRFSVKFTVDGITARYLLKASSVNNPFDLNKIHSFRAPAKL
ncbi:MAG: type VI secretion IcmF C-terminal domain-containing protein [Gammaproteobacteria bacterium]|nr:type VI secretion IcmF C-terminal domain-containing protein [Gammaproteobacteria bacterium]